MLHLFRLDDRLDNYVCWAPYEEPTRSGVFNSFPFQDGLASLVSTTVRESAIVSNKRTSRLASLFCSVQNWKAGQAVILWLNSYSLEHFLL